MISAQDEPNREVQQVAGSSIVCPRCAKENSAGQRFCSQCGSRLWEPCCQCGHLEPASERYCGQCGANLQAALRHMQEHLEAEIDRAKQLERQGEIDEAIALLEQAPKIEHSQLLPLIGLIERTVDRLRRGVTIQMMESKEKIEQAMALANTTQYEQILALLEPIPPPLRTEEAENLLLQTQQKLQRIQQLEAALNGQLQGVPIRQVIADCDELLRLRPGHVRAQQVLEQVSRLLKQKAQKLLAAYRYQDVLRLVDQLPADRQDGELRQIRRRAAEADWLWNDLAQTPLVDPVVPEALRRLEQLSPGHPQLPGLKTALAKRLERAKQNPLLAYAAWASQPKQWRLGCPVEWAWKLQRIRPSEPLQAEIHGPLAGMLWSACGLALQGLGLAQIALDLTPKPESSNLAANLASRLGGLLTIDVFSRKETGPEMAWGIDIGNWAVKAVRLRRGEQDQIEIDRVSVLPYETYLYQADDQEQLDAIVRTLLSLVSLEPMGDVPICISLPMQYTFIQNHSLPYLPPEKQTNVLLFELGRRFSMPLQELVWDYYSALGQAQEKLKARQEKSAEEGSDGGVGVRIGTKDDLLVVGVKRGPAARICQVFREAKLSLQTVQSAAVALYNALSFERNAEPWTNSPETVTAENDSPIALLDVGAAHSVLAVQYRESLWIRPMRFGVAQCRRALVQECGLSYAAADNLLRHPQQAEWLHEMFQAIQPVLATLAEDVQAALEQAALHFPGRSIQKLLCCGGGVRVHGLLRELFYGHPPEHIGH